MNKFVAFSLFVFTSYFAFAAANDTLISFSTPGPDVYADGTAVLDGECYALVWTKAGATFAGFAADGTAVGSDSKVVVFAPVAKGGRCPTVVFELDAALAESYQGGSFGVYLCDTRLANGKVGGLNAKGMPVAVNGYGKAKVGEETSESLQNLEVASSSPSSGKVALMAAPVSSSSLVRVTTESEIPEGTPDPQITAIKVDDAYVYLTVKGTRQCLQYAATEVIVDATPSSSQDKEGSSSVARGEGAASTVQGAATTDEEITLIVSKKSEGGFYKVGRKETK